MGRSSAFPATGGVFCGGRSVDSESMPNWNSIRRRVFANVRKHGWHCYRIYGGPAPPWSYSIGFYNTWDAPELVLAGASVYLNPTVAEAFQTLSERIVSERPHPGVVWDV